MTIPESAETAVRAFAALPTGVHAIPREQAGAMVRARPPADGEAGPALVWVDVSSPGAEEAEFLRSELGFHPLAVEDCIRGRQRPKLDRYPGYFFLVVYAASVNPARNRMALNEVHIFLGEHFLVTVHDYRIQEVGEILARWRASAERVRDVGALAHLLLDVIVDDYFPVLEHFADRAEKMEEEVFHQAAPTDVSGIMGLRHELVLFRKVVAPQREVLSTLLRRDLPFLRPELLPYFQDVHDHTIRVTDEIDSLRELLSALLDAQMSISANQLNQTVRMMTAWSIILMSMALVAGIYGMNFAVMPELGWRWGYAFALALMAGIGSGILLFFRRRGWL
jgi:magnesium transporter